MSTILILLVGVAIVIGGILLFRLHAFLVLIVAALVVSLLTPTVNVYESNVVKDSARIESFNRQTNEIVLGKSIKPKEGLQLILLRNQSDGIKRIGESRLIVQVNETTGAQVVFADFNDGDPVYAWQSGDLAITSADHGEAEAFARQTVGDRVAAGFGTTCVKIGILIAMAAIIGNCLLASGAADRIVRSALSVCGQRGAPAAFVGSSFLLAIPVYFDTVFYLMVPLAKAMRVRTGGRYLFYVLAIFAGGTMAHSLVPPTPGPLLVAEQLGVDIGLMILVGTVVGLFTSTAGYFYARFASNGYDLPLRETTSELNSADGATDTVQIPRDESQLPPLWLSLIPIVLPVILIAGYTILKNVDLSKDALEIFSTVGNPNIALTISAGFAIWLLVRSGKGNRIELARSIQSALASGGVIILITAAGGAFGQAMRQTGVAMLIESLPHGSALITLPLAFLVTTLIRTAQGSATVAMITSVGILGGIATSGALGFHPVWLAVAIGCGSKPLSWMNDSGFWVICKLSGMNEAEGLKFITPMSGAMGLVGLIVTLIGAMLFPMNG